jgi:hypothetical protein
MKVTMFGLLGEWTVVLQLPGTITELTFWVGSTMDCFPWKFLRSLTRKDDDGGKEESSWVGRICAAV